MSKYYIGIDLGGTNIAAGIVDVNGTIFCKKSVKTNLPKPEAELEKDILNLCVSLCEENGYDLHKDIISVGIGTPGSVDGKRGIVWQNVNFGYENWKQDKSYSTTGLTDEYTDILGVPVVKSVIPVRPGRNISIVIETAAVVNRQKKMGYFAAKELLRQLGIEE